MVVNGTHTELRRLQPGVLYNISITALNAAGRGNATILRVSTGRLGRGVLGREGEGVKDGNVQEH